MATIFIKSLIKIKREKLKFLLFYYLKKITQEKILKSKINLVKLIFILI